MFQKRVISYSRQSPRIPFSAFVLLEQNRHGKIFPGIFPRLLRIRAFQQCRRGTFYGDVCFVGKGILPGKRAHDFFRKFLVGTAHECSSFLIGKLERLFVRDIFLPNGKIHKIGKRLCIADVGCRRTPRKRHMKTVFCPRHGDVKEVELVLDAVLLSPFFGKFP